MSSALQEVKKDLNQWLISAERVSPCPGLRTSYETLDNFLLWQGLPQGALSLFHGRSGCGATSLWIETALQVLKQKKWVAWINSPGYSLCPWNILHRSGTDGASATSVDLSRLLVISPPKDTRQLLWVLQELMSLSLFEMIGCHWGSCHSFREHHLLKLKRQARSYQTALVFISPQEMVAKSSNYSLILNFQAHQIQVERALHRSTPFFIQRRNIYADIMPQLSGFRLPSRLEPASDQVLCG